MADKELLKDIIEWDVKNWSNALDFWKENCDIAFTELSCLELGGRNGGLSLWLALNGNKVICSDAKSPKQEAIKLHEKYSCEDKIEYEIVSATNIPYENHFDIVIFKSILGVISIDGNDKLKKQAIDEIYKCLKPNGKLLFAENLEASSMHKFFRKRFIKWGIKWNYLRYDEIEHVFGSFDIIKYKTAGFLGTFGRTEKQRQFLSKIDSYLDRIIPKSGKYILIGIAEKSTNDKKH